jgi:hypothetical protein
MFHSDNFFHSANSSDFSTERIRDLQMSQVNGCTVELGYNDIGLYDTPSITSHILWYQLIPHC